MTDLTDEIGYGVRKVLVNTPRDSKLFNIPKRLVQDFKIEGGNKYHVFINRKNGIIFYVPEKLINT